MDRVISAVLDAITAAVTNEALTGSAGTVALLVLLALLIQKEMLAASNHPRAGALGKALNVAIIPLLLLFVLTAIARVVSALE